jgi:hypothetical protein
MIRIFCLLLCAIAISTRGAGLGEPLVFTGTCDASTGTALGGDLFVVANDEDNILRFYRISRPGKPVQTHNLNPLFSPRPKSPEADLEGAARLGSRVFFISSHGRNKEGKFAPARNRLFALELTERNGEVAVQSAGNLYTNLVADLARDPKYLRFRLAEAAERSPEQPGSFNIEGLAGTPEGTLLIGFRSPIPERRALLVPLLNPNEVITGEPPRFGEPILLDLGGLGVRDIGSTTQGYYLLAGPDDGNAQSRLFFWAGGASLPRASESVQFSRMNPEGICFLDVSGGSDMLILSDDGSRKIGGKECKSLPEAERQFRAYRFTP